MPQEIEQEKIVIFDANIPELENNKLFIPEKAVKISHTILPICFLYEEAVKKGIQIVTPDVYLRMEPKPKALLISHLKTNYSGILINKFRGKVRPVILTCQESPFIATRFYLGLLLFSKRFLNSFVFSGMRKKISKKSNYEQMFFPQPYSIVDFAPLDFYAKKGLVMVAGSKSIESWKKNLALKLMYGFSVKEIYSERLKAVKFFAGKKSFDLYGSGWDKLDINTEDSLLVKKVYHGLAENKFETLKKYKFTFCFENAIFPGYITEKIFDAIFAGSIPVYYGAPDIKKYVPADTFIDLNDFNNYDDLHLFMESIGKEKYEEYMNAMRSFINSEKYRIFSQDYFASRVISILEEEFKKL